MDAGRAAALLILSSLLGATACLAATPPCDACHGTHGEGMAAAHVPRLAGQSVEYLQKQLDDYADGTRSDPVMANFFNQLTKADRGRLAAHYAAMPAAYRPAPHPAQSAPAEAARLKRGHELASQGDEIKRVAACNSCHGPDGIGVAPAAPYLAGQSAEYLMVELNAFRQGTRKNDAGQLMRSVAERLDDGDIAAVAAYFAGVNP